MFVRENEPGNALLRDDTAQFNGLYFDQLSVAGSMLRRVATVVLAGLPDLSALSGVWPESPDQKIPVRGQRILPISETDRNRKTRESLIKLMV